MWPKVIAQLFELLPHISRLLPLADKVLQQKSSTDTALTTLSDSVRGDLGKVARAHIDLAARLDEFATHVQESAADSRRTRATVESLEARLTRIERTIAPLRATLIVASITLVATLTLLVLLLVRAH